MTAEHPCLRCGACCAFFRVSFHWSEAGDQPGVVPAHFVEQVSPHRVAMRGTTQDPVRCVGLLGEVGEVVRCSLYDVRSTTCRTFAASYEDGTHHEACDRARAAYGLEPLRPEDWERPQHPDQPQKPKRRRRRAS